MNISQLPEIVKVLGIGSGAGGIITASYFVIQHLKVRENSKRIEALGKRCNGQDRILEEHTKQLVGIDERTKNIDKNVGRLLKLHIKK